MNTAEKISAEYESGKAHNAEIDLYETVKRNENFFIGKQWEGVNAPKDLDKPVINILKRVVSYFVAMIHSDDIGIAIKPFYSQNTAEFEAVASILKSEIEQAIEITALKSKNRDAVRNAAVDGDCCCYVSFNPEVEVDQRVKGAIEAQIIDNTNVIFGNPRTGDIQQQRYIIVSARRNVNSVRSEALKNGIAKDVSDSISADNEENAFSPHNEGNMVTVLTKFYKKGQTVWCVKTAGNVVIKPEYDTGYKLFPLAWMSWDKVKNSYHGQAAISGLIPNQVFINKLYAMAMRHVKTMAFPKIVYNKNAVEYWDNTVGQAIGVMGDPNQAIAGSFKAPDMSAQVMQLIQQTISDTRDTMGASDAALGNIKPDNTSAIVAVQQSSAMPLQLQKMAYYQYVEDIVRIMADIMRVHYGVREAAVTLNGKEQTVLFDFSRLCDVNMRLNIDIGASSYFSELMQVQTVDSLMSKGIIPDALTYIECIPDSYIKNKQKIIDAIKKKQEQEKQQLQEQPMTAAQGGEQTNALPAMQN